MPSFAKTNQHSFFRYLLMILSITLCSLSAKQHYQIPESIKFMCSRSSGNASIVYYFSKPKNQSKQYPIVMLCEGSSGKDDLESVMFMHQYFGERIDALHCGLVTVEKWGIDGNAIDEEVFWSHYTRSQRFHDHSAVIKQLENNPPDGWDGSFIFLGVSEGGPLVNQLSVTCSKTRATINWVGAGHWNWADELWEWLANERSKHWFLAWLYNLLPRWVQFLGDFPENRQEYDKRIDHIKTHPSPCERFAGMTYLYHADACAQKPIDYSKIYAPMLVVAGAHDSIIRSCDEFISRAQDVGAPITYLRVEGMDHWIRKRPDVIDQSFTWLKQYIEGS